MFVESPRRPAPRVPDPDPSRCARIILKNPKKIHFRDERTVQNPLLETAATGQSMPMTAVPRTGPGCLGSPPAQALSSSLAGVQGAPKRLGVSKPSWIVRTEVLVSPTCAARFCSRPQFVERLLGA
jgi:hypothetical protein